MNLPELITKLLIIEHDLIQQGIEVNEVKILASHCKWDDSIFELNEFGLPEPNDLTLILKS